MTDSETIASAAAATVAAVTEAAKNDVANLLSGGPPTPVPESAVEPLNVPEVAVEPEGGDVVAAKDAAPEASNVEVQKVHQAVHKVQPEADRVSSSASDGCGDSVYVEISPIEVESLSMLQSMLLPFQAVCDRDPALDAERKVAVVQFQTRVAAAGIVESGLADYTCRRIPAAEGKARMEAAAKQQPGTVVVKTRGREVGTATAYRQPLASSDPFFVLMDVRVVAPLYLAFQVLLMFLGVFF